MIEISALQVIARNKFATLFSPPALILRFILSRRETTVNPLLRFYFTLFLQNLNEI